MINTVNLITELKNQAEVFIRSYYDEMEGNDQQCESRLSEVFAEISETGTYTHTKQELTFGAKIAWRNNAKCIGRLFWDSLEVFDERGAETEEEIAAALLRHIAYATNEGRIRPALTAFAPSSPIRQIIRIWNHQLIRYAGYRTSDGIVGDPDSVELTEAIQRLGWTGQGTKYDVLPLVIQVGSREPKWFPIPEGAVKEVTFKHPDIVSFAELGLKWYAVPILSDMALDIGGVRYTAAPFNGWYMGTEIGARNLSDKERYDELPAIADLLGLDRSTNTSLWKDRALLELNLAVVHSFKVEGVSIVDHHTAAEQFMRFMKREHEQERDVNARWSWLIPPMSPATTLVWHHSELNERDIDPDYTVQKRPY